MTVLLALGMTVVGACGDDDGQNNNVNNNNTNDNNNNNNSLPTTGTIAGTVTDADGIALTGALVMTTPATLEATTGADGGYSLEVEAGTYTVTASLAGYVSAERTGVAVTAGNTVTLDLILTVATGELSLQVNDACGTGGLEGVTVTIDGTTVGTTDADGALDLADLLPGSYTAELSAPGYLPDSTVGLVLAGEMATADATLICQTKAVGDLARDFTSQLGATFSGVTTAQAVHDLIYDGDVSNDPTIISVRSSGDYALGHLPGAINIPWKTVADDPIGLLGVPDGSQNLVDYCYTGHTGAIAASILNLLGYHTSNLKFGIVSWTTDATALTANGVQPDLTRDFATETTANTPTDTYDLPWLEFDDVTTPFEAAQKAAQAYLATAVPTISAQALFDLLNDGDTSNDPFIISVRKPEHYALGHIPGAVNIGYAAIADEANLRMIPTDRDVVVYCYTGHTGGIATGILGTLGYRVKNLKFGIHAWTQDAAVLATTPFNPATDVHDFPLVP